MSKLYDLLYTMIGKLNSSVKTTAQTLTDAEKSQARANIGAQPVGDYATKKDIPTIPSKLPNPHALTINGETYDGSSAVSITVEGGGGMGGADWNASEGEPGHVLNRTHWVEGGRTLLAEIAEGSYSTNIPFTPVLGEEYLVTFGESTYQVVAKGKQDGQGNAIVYIGNASISQETAENTGEPWLYFGYVYNGELVAAAMWTDESVTDKTIFVYRENVHKLDPKFLPDGLQIGDEDVYIIPETTLNFAPQPDFYGLTGAMLTVPSDDAHRPDMGYYTIINYNGVDYKCPARGGGGDVFLGNTSLAAALVPGAVDTGEPFFIYWLGNYQGSGYDLWAILPKDGSTPATFSARVLKAKPIDYRYIDIPVFDLNEAGVDGPGRYSNLSAYHLQILNRGLQLGMLKIRDGDHEAMATKGDTNEFLQISCNSLNCKFMRYYVHPLDQYLQVEHYKVAVTEA